MATPPTPPAPGTPSAPTERTVAYRRAVVRLATRTTVMVVALTVSYYLLPAHSPASDAGEAARLVGALVAVALVAVVLRAQLLARRRGFAGLAAVEALLTVLYLLVLVFAQVYYRMALASDAQFVDLTSRTDALYFTTTLVTTVGFGDVHPEGTAARAVATVQMLFNLLYLGTAVKLLSHVRAGRASAPDPPAAPGTAPRT